MDLKSIKVTPQTKKLLDACKDHPRETYDDLLKRIAADRLRVKKPLQS
jgi:hypothetical protein